MALNSSGIPDAVEEPSRAGAPRTPKQRRGEASRQRILDEAWTAFADKGFRGASFNEIAKASGLTLAGLIFHFPNKVELFAAVLRAIESADAEGLIAKLGPEPSAFEVFDAYADTARINADRYRFVQLTHLNSAESASSPEHPGSEFSIRHFQFSRAIVADAVRRSMAEGLIRTDVDPDAIALQVVAVSEGIENQWLQEPDAIDLARSYATWVEQLKEYLRP